MAGDKKFTQEQMDKAAAKAVAGEQKRCIAAVKSVDLTDVTKPKAVIGMAVAAIKAAE